MTSLFAVGVVDAQDSKNRTPSISDVMRKVNSKMGLSKAVGKALRGDTVSWSDVEKQTKEIVEHIEDLGKNTPPKGSKESWEKLTKEYLENAKALNEAVKKKDKAKATEVMMKIGRSCGACHNVHQDKG